jgi:hypothetical protein
MIPQRQEAKNAVPLRSNITPASDERDQPPVSTTEVITEDISKVINNKKSSPYDLQQILSKHKDETDLVALHFGPDKHNILHEIIACKRHTMMSALVLQHLWEPLMEDVIPSSSESSIKGQTPMQMAESICSKHCKNEMTKYEELVHSQTDFLSACHRGDQDKAMEMVRQNPNVLWEQDTVKNNCLYWAIVSRNLDLFQSLLDAGADYNNVNKNKENLLHVACMLGHSTFIPVLMKKCRLDVTALCSAKRTPLERVAENGDVTSLKERQEFIR